MISQLLPLLLRRWAESDGRAGRVYWWLAGKKTPIGAILVFMGAGLTALGSSFPEHSWATSAADVILYVGAGLAAVGLVDGGVRSPWPKGTRIPPGDKRG